MLQTNNTNVVVAVPVPPIAPAVGAFVVIVGQKNSKGGADGAVVGDFVVPYSVGLPEGEKEGSSVGIGVIVGFGLTEGESVREEDGAGDILGRLLAATVGLYDGGVVGLLVGLSVA